MPVREDNRLADAPMQPLRCLTCESVVAVRKSSRHQTSIQWDDAAMATCPERRSAVPGPGPNGEYFEGCRALRESIREAVHNGRLDVPDDGY